MTEKERSFHDSMKPSWGPDGTLVYAAPSNPQRFARSSRRARERDGLLTVAKTGVVSESRDVRFAKFSNEVSMHIFFDFVERKYSCVLGIRRFSRKAQGYRHDRLY